MRRATKADTTRQPERELTPEQELAICALLEGATDAVAGERAGVIRQTVNGWRNHDEVFAAELNRRRRSLWEGHQDKLRALVGEAVDVLAVELRSDDAGQRAAAARVILRSAAGLAPSGPLSADKQRLEWKNERNVNPLEFALDWA